jgi:hypothetical protein
MKVLLPILLILMVACTDRDSEAEAAAEETPDPSVFDPLTGTLDRAAGVEDTLRDSAAERRRQLEEAEGR